jgi:regulator of nucleoside diphosphate kinase
MQKPSIIVSSVDHARLRLLLDSARLDHRVAPEHLTALDIELARATIVAPGKVPADVVTMYSTVYFREVGSDEEEHYTLVQPFEADVVRDRISVLAPIGTALLGYRVGDVVEWNVPSGATRLEITKVVRPDSGQQALPEQDALSDASC